jgi:hypothetical protein
MKVIIKNYVDHMSLSYRIANILSLVIGKDSVYALACTIEKTPCYDFFADICLTFTMWLESRRVSVKIDRWDTYSMDSTLTHIILPMLKQIRTELNGAPLCDYRDADANLHPSDDDLARMELEPGWTDDNYFKRWGNIIDKMIEAFEIHKDDSDMYPNGDKKEKLENGLRLFGKYYMNLWT